MGLVAAECFVRLLIPYSLFYNTWFEAGIHQPDDELGFVFAGNYVGGMRHRDQTWRVPLELDENGFRQSMSTHDDSDTPRQDVVLLGGRSMMFSYGLPDDQTIAARVADHSAAPVSVHTLAQPGFDIGRDFYKFRRYCEGRLFPSVVVVSVYVYEPELDGLLAEYSPIPEKPEGDLFRFHEGIAIERGELPRRIGRPFFQSYVLAGGCRLVDRVQFEASRLKNLVSGRPSPGCEHQAAAVEGTAPDAVRLRGGRNDLLSNLQDYFGQRDAELIVFLLPKYDGHYPAATNASLQALDRVHVLDLRESLQRRDSDWKAAGHYGPRSARIVGARIADAIQPLLKASYANNEKRRPD